MHHREVYTDQLLIQAVALKGNHGGVETSMTQDGLVCVCVCECLLKCVCV